jgi:hypothetical protein
LKSKGFPDDRRYTRSVHRWSRRSVLRSGSRKSGIYLFRKRVPERLKGSVGKSEIKFSLRTRDAAIARIRHLEELVKIERAWSGIDAAIIHGDGRVLAPLQCKSASDTGPAGTIAAGAVSSPTDPSADHSLNTREVR